MIELLIKTERKLMATSFLILKLIRVEEIIKCMKYMSIEQCCENRVLDCKLTLFREFLSFKEVDANVGFEACRIEVIFRVWLQDQRIDLASILHVRCCRVLF